MSQLADEEEGCATDGGDVIFEVKIRIEINTKVAGGSGRRKRKSIEVYCGVGNFCALLRRANE